METGKKKILILVLQLKIKKMQQITKEWINLGFISLKENRSH